MYEMTNKSAVPILDMEKPESAKTILENIDAILKELANELARIESAIYEPRPCGEKNEPRDESLLATLNRQRNTAEELLKQAVHISRGLW